MASPTIDGSAINTANASGTTSGTVTLTTTNANDIIVIDVSIENTTAQGSTNKVTSISKTSGTGTVGTFVKRAALNGIASNSASAFDGLERWWAVATTALTGAVFTVNFNIAQDDCIIAAYGVSGVGSTTAPWDPNASLPAISSNVGSGAVTQTSASVSTSNPDDLLIWASCNADPNTPSAPAGFTLIKSGHNALGTLQIGAGSFSESLSATITGSTFTNGSTNGYIVIVDALTADAPVAGGASVEKVNFLVDKFRTPGRSQGPNAGLFPVRAFPGPTADAPTYYIPRPFPTQWNTNCLLLKGTAQDLTSPAVETNTHFISKAFPPQWALNRALGQGTAQDLTSPAVETNPQWRGLPWPCQWGVQPALRQNPATDAPVVVSAAETNPHWIGRTWPLQWAVLKPLWQTTAQDTSSAGAAETNPQWRGLPWPVQWWLTLALTRNPATDAPVVAAADTPIQFVPLQWDSQWNVDVSLVEGGAQDETSPAVETNQQWQGKPWTLQWSRQLSLWQNPALDAPVVVSAAETNTHFVGRQVPPWWNLNRSLGQGTAQDFSTPTPETNTYSNLHAWVPSWAPRWTLQASLLQGTAQDFSSTAPVNILPYSYISSSYIQ